MRTQDAAIATPSAGPATGWGQTLLSFEMAFVAFLLSGSYKATAVGRLFPIDATVFTGALTLIIGITIVLRSGGLPRRFLPALCSGVLLIVWLATTLTWSSGSGATQSGALSGLVLVAIAFLGAGCVIAPDPRRVERFLGIFAGFTVLLLLITVNLIRPASGIDAAASSNRISRAIAMTVGAQVLLAFALTSGHRWWTRTGAFILALLFMAAVLFTGTRQALIGFVIGLPILLPLAGRTLRSSKWGAGLLLGLLVVGLASAGPKFWQSLYTIRRLEVFLSGRLGSSGDARVLRLRAGVAGFEASPLVGNGLGSFGDLWGVNAMDHPHNVVVEVMYDGGLVGLSLLAALAVFTLLRFPLGMNGLRGLARYALPCALIVVGFSSLVSSTIGQDRLLWGFLGLSTLGVVAAGRSPTTV